MPKGKPINPRPNQELQRRANAKREKEEKHAKITTMQTTDKWKDVIDAFIIEEERSNDKTISALSQLIEYQITYTLFEVSKPIIKTSQIKEYLRDKYEDDYYKKGGRNYMNEIHLKHLTDDELKTLFESI